MTAEALHTIPPDVLPNLRDVGGLTTDTGGTTRPGVLLRSAAPLAGDRLPELAGWPPALVLDLRGGDELGGLAHPLTAPGTLVHALPLLDRAVTPEAGGEPVIDWDQVPDLATAYLHFLERSETKLATITELVAAAEGAALVHCAAGKDRTGVVVAVLLRAVGVSREAITADYLLTEPELPAILARPNNVVADATRYQRLLGVPAEAITGVLDMLDDTPGGAAGWLRARGVADDVLAAWRLRILG
ncbi:tyrosine-protein phosphatase PtbB [Pseudonocardia eucalypti]|uniref:Tyrosine-protein phosphatase PtbB n=1 Tax=Pseudonocardia eucalypti TaxID=648755 RepID=A0ABP9QDW2_9PSEU|nr:hypothetical protein [Pseudonocardia eucalypti]